MKTLQILGTGCPKCKKLAENTETAAKELGVEYDLVKITDINAIMGFGVMMTPALVVDGQVKVVGKVPDVAEIKKLLAWRPDARGLRLEQFHTRRICHE
jgi:small redox-active disulfide protein 2